MPTYEYRCDGCGKTEERQLRVDQVEQTLVPCVTCSGFSETYVFMRRIISAVPAIFRGGGWASKS